MKHIKIFETTTEYNAFKLSENFITPNISLCEDAPTVIHYEPYVAPVGPDPYNGHEYVEIGGLKWATMNIGASNITDYGLKFQWGDTQGYTSSQVGNGTGEKPFKPNDYKYFDNNYQYHDDGSYTKYNDSDNLVTLQSSDDAAQAAWGGAWRMPTNAEFQALVGATTSIWTSNYQGSGVNGFLFTDKTDSSKVLFFPAAGQCANGIVNSLGSNGDYWTSSLSYDKEFANCVTFWNNHIYYEEEDGEENWDYRYHGLSVRCVVG